LFWDARANKLEEQVLHPLFDPYEMGNTKSLLYARLANSDEYMRLFQLAFPKDERFELEQLYTALAAFQTSLISLDSPYDRYRNGEGQSMNDEQKRGMALFFSNQTRCSECHQPPFFTNHKLAIIGAPDRPGQAFDNGAGDVFNQPKLRGAFRVPSLRNIASTAPYMHSGALSGLQDVLEFYNAGRGSAVPAGVQLNIHWHIWEPNLSQKELKSLASFMEALTDEQSLPEIPKRLPSGMPVIVY
jgi:cytochrome c peroxidase